jgi:hypothetical protein
MVSTGSGAADQTTPSMSAKLIRNIEIAKSDARSFSMIVMFVPRLFLGEFADKSVRSQQPNRNKCGTVNFVSKRPKRPNGG